MAPRIRYRVVKKVYRIAKTGRITVGEAEVLGRYVRANVKKNYANPVVRRKG